jgi:hypothetical protein
MSFFNQLLLTSFFLLHTFIASGNAVESSHRTLYFHIVLNDKIIGNLMATRNKKDANLFHQSVTSINSTILKK